MEYKKILVTGGAGYIGSHTVVALLELGCDVVILDNYSNSSVHVIDRIEQICKQRPELVEGDVRNTDLLHSLFEQYNFDAVIHFAGLKSIPESLSKPLTYYENNVQGCIALFSVMQQHHCFNLVFSSSATVYGEPKGMPINEQAPLHATNPYGQTKLIAENMLRDLSAADERWHISILRYFNPVAAHPSGLLGEAPNGIPNNLMPYIAQVSAGILKTLQVYGNDYPTPDGTGVRDYIHVVDLADAHIKALTVLKSEHGCHVFNIGTGKGYSVLEMIHAFEKASGLPIDYKIKGRRPGDVAECYADPTLSEQVLGWKAVGALS